MSQCPVSSCAPTTTAPDRSSSPARQKPSTLLARNCSKPELNALSNSKWEALSTRLASEPACAELAEAIARTEIHTPICPVYQNVDAQPHTDPEEIKANLVAQLTAPVRWTQTVKNMIADGATEFA